MTTVKITLTIIAACILLWTVLALVVLSSADHSSNVQTNVPQEELGWECVGVEC
jgi:hypothetical protein